MPAPKVEAARYADHDDAICAIAKQSRYTRDFTSHMFFRNDIQGTYARGEVGVALAPKTRDVLGFVYVKHLKVKSRPLSVVHFMGVHEACREHGIGRKLLDWALATSPHGRVELSCEHSNIEGMKFYERCGYTPVFQGVYGDKNPRPYTRWCKVR